MSLITDSSISPNSYLKDGSSGNRNSVAHAPSVESPAVATGSQLSNRSVKAAASQLLNLGTLPKGFAKLLREFGSDEQRASVAAARKARAETFALSGEARRIIASQVNRDLVSAKRVTFADAGNGKARLSYSA